MSEDAGDDLVVRGELALQLIEALSKLLVRGQHLSKLHEGAHNVEAHLDGAW